MTIFAYIEAARSHEKVPVRRSIKLSEEKVFPGTLAGALAMPYRVDLRYRITASAQASIIDGASPGALDIVRRNSVMGLHEEIYGGILRALRDVQTAIYSGDAEVATAMIDDTLQKYGHDAAWLDASQAFAERNVIQTERFDQH